MAKYEANRTAEARYGALTVVKVTDFELEVDLRTGSMFRGFRRTCYDIMTTISPIAIPHWRLNVFG